MSKQPKSRPDPDPLDVAISIDTRIQDGFTIGSRIADSRPNPEEALLEKETESGDYSDPTLREGDINCARLTVLSREILHTVRKSNKHRGTTLRAFADRKNLDAKVVMQAYFRGLEQLEHYVREADQSRRQG